VDKIRETCIDTSQLCEICPLRLGILAQKLVKTMYTEHIPDEAKLHFRSSYIEFLKALKAIIDYNLGTEQEPRKRRKVEKVAIE
jgi:hypothetical protein